MNIEKALKFATFHHDGQNRRGFGQIALPYIFHPIEVAKTLYDWECNNEHIIVGALLHDLLEDTSCPPPLIEFEFGLPILNLVEELTFRGPKKEKDIYLKSFENKSIEAVLIKCADRLCNVRDFYNQGSKNTLRYLEAANCLFEVVRKRDEELTIFSPNLSDKLFDQLAVMQRLLNV